MLWRLIPTHYAGSVSVRVSISGVKPTIQNRQNLQRALVEPEGAS